jgi:hypothetical protein
MDRVRARRGTGWGDGENFFRGNCASRWPVNESWVVTSECGELSGCYLVGLVIREGLHAA